MNYELRLQNADLGEFEEELRIFAAGYVSDQAQPEIDGITVVEAVYRDQVHRPVDPLLTKVFAVDLYRHREWLHRETLDGPTFYVTRRGDSLILSFTNAYLPEANPFVIAFIERCKVVWGVSPLQTNTIGQMPAQQEITTHPTDRTRERFETFKQLKQAHPDWTQARVAREACDVLNDPNITEETVGDVYKTMGMPWPRGKRTR